MTHQPRLMPVMQDYENNALSYIAAGRTAQTTTFNDVPLDQNTAEQLSKKDRAIAVPQQLNGTYLIHRVNFKSETTTRIEVFNIKTGLEFTAGFTDHSLKQDTIQLLKDAAFDKTPVYLSIEGRVSSERVHSATIISVAVQPN